MQTFFSAFFLYLCLWSRHADISPIIVFPTTPFFAKTIQTQNKNKEELVQDAFFWPCLSSEQVKKTLDSDMQPSVCQEYNVPAPRDDEYVNHDTAAYSMWMHFNDFCHASQVYDSSTGGVDSIQQRRDTKTTSSQIESEYVTGKKSSGFSYKGAVLASSAGSPKSLVKIQGGDSSMRGIEELSLGDPEFNVHTNRPRSPVFRTLAKGLSLTDSVVDLQQPRTPDRQGIMFNHCTPERPQHRLVFGSDEKCGGPAPLLFQFPALLETNVSTIEALPSIELFGDKSLLLLPSCLVDDIMPNDHLKQQSFWPPTSCGANRAGFLGVESCDIKIPAYSSSCLVGNGYSNSNGMLGECSILNVF